jgi:hypothetical protein
VELIDDGLKADVSTAVLHEYSKLAPPETLATKPIPASW